MNEGPTRLQHLSMIVQSVPTERSKSDHAKVCDGAYIDPLGRIFSSHTGNIFDVLRRSSGGTMRKYISGNAGVHAAMRFHGDPQVHLPHFRPRLPFFFTKFGNIRQNLEIAPLKIFNFFPPEFLLQSNVWYR